SREMTPEQEKEYWCQLTDILLYYYNKKIHIKKRIRELQNLLSWAEADRLTEIERLKRLFKLPYEPAIADRKTLEEIMEELWEERFEAGYIRGKPVKVRAVELLPRSMISMMARS
ncbi:MAG: hypothetical protein QW815_08020, partial [Nitrososphaerota archaeon]